VLRDGVTIFPAMLDAISSATRTVDLLTFVYWRGTSPGGSRRR
jgi:cardiolipin synthase A/B